MRALVMFSVAALVAMSSNGSAQPSQENAELLQMIKALQARVAELEAQRGKPKQKADRDRIVAPPSRPPQLPVAIQGGFEPSDASITTVGTAPPPNAYSWSGAYWGASFGGGLTEGRVASRETFTASSNNPPPSNLLGVSSVAESGPSRGIGAVADLFVGISTTFGPFVAGIQLEGTLAELSFGSSGTRSYTYFDANGPTGQTALGPFRPHVHSRWMVSALARAGWLVDPRTLLYGLAGWTGAQFDYQNLTDNLFFQPGERFWANGITMGVGLEKRLDANWALRGEYRYTHFPEATVNNGFVWSNAGSPFLITQSNAIQSRFRQ